MPSKRDEELEPASSGRMNPAKFVDLSKECAPIGQRIHESKRMIVKAWRARTGRRVRCWPPSPSYRDRQRRATTVSEDDELLLPHRAKERSRHHSSLAGAEWDRLRSQCWMNVRPTGHSDHTAVHNPPPTSRRMVKNITCPKCRSRGIIDGQCY
jgi:hypothetical protein